VRCDVLQLSVDAVVTFDEVSSSGDGGGVRRHFTTVETRLRLIFTIERVLSMADVIAGGGAVGAEYLFPSSGYTTIVSVAKLAADGRKTIQGSGVGFTDPFWVAG
jgi:hypothetical protein